MTDISTSALSIDRIVVVHGATATPDRHWYPSFAASVRVLGVAVAVPQLPDTMEPDAEAWRSSIGDAVGTPTVRTMIVAHSLGAAATLQYLSGLPNEWRLGALVTVAGFAKAPAEPLQQFVDGIDLDAVARNTAVRHAFISPGDPRVPASFTVPLADGLDATVHELDGMGHFMDDDEVVSIPELERLAASVIRG